MDRPYTVEAQYSYLGAKGLDAQKPHRTRSFSSFDTAYDYARWARNRALFAWALVRHGTTPVQLWAEGRVVWTACEAQQKGD